jgi:hypothetical protein
MANLDGAEPDALANRCIKEERKFTPKEEEQFSAFVIHI